MKDLKMYKNWKRCWYCGRKTRRKMYLESPKNHIRKAPVCFYCVPKFKTLTE